MNRVADIQQEPARRTDFSNSLGTVGSGGGSFPNSGAKKGDVNTGPMGETGLG